MELLENMFKMQNELNMATNGDKWTTGVSKNGNEINWLRCIFNEIAEYENSFFWKHWKDTTKQPQFEANDFKNAQMEWIDNWHFFMSYLIQNGIGADVVEGYAKLAKDFTNNVDDKLVSKAIILELAEEMVYHLYATKYQAIRVMNLKSSENPDEKEIEKYVSTINFAYKNAILIFFIVLEKLEMSIDDLYSLYMVKNVLNGFRQDNGYKEGTYVKIWGEVEDNDAARAILDNNPGMVPEVLYNELQLAYNEVLENSPVKADPAQS